MSQTVTQKSSNYKNDQSHTFKFSIVNEVSDVASVNPINDLPQVSFSPRQSVLDRILAYSREK